MFRFSCDVVSASMGEHLAAINNCETSWLILLTFLLLSSSACVRTASSFSRVASVLCRTPSFSSSFWTTNSWASTCRVTATVTLHAQALGCGENSRRCSSQVIRHLGFECENLVGQLLLLLFQQLVDLVGFDSLAHQLEIGVVLLP